LRIREAIRRSTQTQRFRREAPNAFPIHGKPCGARRRDHPITFLLELDQRRRRNRFDLGHDELRPLARDQLPQGVAVEHVDDMPSMRNLHRRRIGITIDGDHFATETLQLDRNFLTELTRTEQHDPSGGSGQRGTERCHGGGTCGGKIEGYAGVGGRDRL